MKLLNRYTTDPLALLASFVLRLWVSTLETRFVGWNQTNLPQPGARSVLYIVWHENLIFGLGDPWRKHLTALASRNRDGKLISRIIELSGGSVIEGSTSRGAATALRNMFKLAKSRNLVITPDGPRGPRRQAQSGAVLVASKTGVPIIPVAVSARSARRAGSWDKMLLPIPMTRCYVIGGAPIVVPPDLDEAGIEAFAGTMQTEMNRLQSQADELADGNRPCPPDALTRQQIKARYSV